MAIFRSFRAVRALLAAAALALPAFALTARAADTVAEVALQRTLDTPIENLELDKVELSKAFEEIASRGKISLQVDPACYELLPYGSTTKVSATFRQSKLRDSIDEILRPLALEKSVSGATVIITPTPPLARVGRRATWEELNILQRARTEDLPVLNDIRWTTDLRTILGVGTLNVEIANATGPANDAAIDQVKKQLPARVWKALDTYAAATGQIWFVNGTTIQVMPQKQWVERQLLRRVEIHKTNRPLAEIVGDISHTSGIHFTPEPGLYTAFPGVTLNSTGGTVREVLDTLVGVIGIAYELRDDSIYIRQAKNQPAPATAPRPDSIVGQIVIPLAQGGGSFMMFVRESDLPPELAEAQKKMHEAVDALQKSLLPPAPVVPATAPASAPATNTSAAAGPAPR